MSKMSRVSKVKKQRDARNRRAFVAIVFHIIVVIFIVQLLSIMLVAIGTVILLHTEVIERPLPVVGVVVVAFSSLMVGTALSAVLIRKLTTPYQKLINAIRGIAAGHFDTRLELSGVREADILADSFNKMARELSGIETLRNDFVRNVAHEFRTPVASITGFAKLLRKDNLTPENRAEYIDIIIRESERLSQLSSNVLMLSKLENQEIQSERRTFLLDEQLRRVILMLEPEWKRKRIDLAADLSACVCCGGEELLTQVWINLINNAIKFTPAAGRIIVTLRQGGGRITVRVTDNGVGMGGDTIQRIFEKFYQGDKSHATKGNGLGLPLVKRILEMIGGTVTIESAPGQGTVAEVILGESWIVPEE